MVIIIYFLRQWQIQNLMGVLGGVDLLCHCLRTASCYLLNIGTDILGGLSPPKPPLYLPASWGYIRAVSEGKCCSSQGLFFISHLEIVQGKCMPLTLDSAPHFNHLGFPHLSFPSHFLMSSCLCIQGCILGWSEKIKLIRIAP